MRVIRVRGEAGEQRNSCLAANRHQWGDHTDQTRGGLSIFNLHPWVSPAVESPSVEICKSQLDVVLGSLVWVVCVSRGGRGDIQRSLQPLGDAGKGRRLQELTF